MVQNLLTDQEITFVKDIIKNRNGKMSWKACWEAGTQLGYFKRYGNEESLRVTCSCVKKEVVINK